MRIVKPYGNSASNLDESGHLTRSLYAHSFPNDPRDMTEFAKTHPKLVIAQWISCIDKIITRPNSPRKPHERQWALRNALGQQAWDLIMARGLLPGLEQRMKRLEREWWSRIHPYGSETDANTLMSFRGRWYAAFAGDSDADTFDAAAVAENLYQHLYIAERPIARGRQPKRLGMLIARAESITKNVARPISDPDPLTLPWTIEDQAAYCQPGDVAARILDSLKGLVGQREARLRQRCTIILKEHVAKVSQIVDGDDTTRSRLQALHDAVRYAYKSVLDTKHSHLVEKLPASAPALMRRVDERFLNRQINALLRLGRVIHYEATPAGELSHISNIVANWPTNVSGSRYWTTGGQIEIKRNESFVRVWKTTLALASRTLTDWADPNRSIGRDILGGREIRRAIDDMDEAAFDAKARLLFGGRSEIFRALPRQEKQEVLRHSLMSLRDLRNNAFHFVGLRGLLTALKSLDTHGSAAGMQAVTQLWRDDCAKKNERLVEILNSANVPIFMTAPEAQKLLDSIQSIPVQVADLPALRRVLDRASKAWKLDKFRLALPATPRDHDNLPQQCQFTAIMLLYERGFAKWLAGLPTQALRTFIDRAVTRTTVAARLLTKDDTANARAAGRFKMADGDTIVSYLRRVEAAITTENRTFSQEGGQQRDTSKFLDDLHCDVIAQALENFLRSQGFDWLASDFSRRKGSEDISARKAWTKGEQPALDAKPWQVSLYFLLHLVPVDDVSHLVQELGRFSDWAGLDAALLQEIEQVLDVYRLMHDAKFVGEGIHFDSASLAELFESDAPLLDAIVKNPSRPSQKPVLTRGLRELFRFGDARLLASVFGTEKVKTEEIETHRSRRRSIALLQNRRRLLHEQWGRSGRKIAPDDVAEYAGLIRQITEYRHLSDDVTLTNHLRLHRLLIDVLARLLVFAGQWERDVYLVTIALIHVAGISPAQVFSRRNGRSPIETGQVVDALRNIQNTPEAKSILEAVTKIFGLVGRDIRGENINTRNDLAHFNCLHADLSSLDLTELVNRVRRLMAYDRKQENAVSKSVKDLLGRRNLSLSWDYKAGLLSSPVVVGRNIVHLEDKSIREPLVSDRFLRMVQRLFRAL